MYSIYRDVEQQVLYTKKQIIEQIHIIIILSTKKGNNINNN